MRILLVVALFAVAVPATAEAQRWGATQSSSGFSAHGGGDRGRDPGRDSIRTRPDFEHPGDRDDRRDRRRGGGAYIYSDYDSANDRVGDRAWQPDSFNDWWHDSPRAYPAWVARNSRCERMWWSGGGWRC